MGLPILIALLALPLSEAQAQVNSTFDLIPVGCYASDVFNEGAAFNRSELPIQRLLNPGARYFSDCASKH